MIETGQNYADFIGVLLRGTCEIIEDPETVARFMRELGGNQPKDAAPRAAASSAPKRVVLKITPLKISSWDHRKLGGKY
jgi:hypothetical protein